jgi:RNA polymerase sigma factor (sigma-70 family)
MSSAGSVTNWIAELRAGEQAALQKLHDRYWPMLVRCARKKLGATTLPGGDEQDVAQEAFWGFYHALRTGRLPRLKTRHDLWALFTVITARRVAKWIDRANAIKRGRRRTVEILADGASDDSAGHAGPRDPNHPPDEEAMLQDCYEHYLARLPDALRPVAELYLTGLTYPEIAERLGCARRTIERKVPIILRRWQALAAESMSDDS